MRLTSWRVASSFVRASAATPQLTAIYAFACCDVCVLILLLMCPHTAACVRILRDMCPPHTAAYVSSYCYSVLILVHMCPHTARYVSSSYCCMICVLILQHMCSHTAACVLILLHMCLDTATHVAVYVVHMCAPTYTATYCYTCVLILLHMCLDTATYVRATTRSMRGSAATCFSSAGSTGLVRAAPPLLVYEALSY